MAKRANIEIGTRYGRLEVIKEIESLNRRRRFICKCDCGVIRPFFLIGLSMGQSTSCGCYKTEIFVARNTSHSLSHDPLYSVRTAIIQRCTNKDNVSYCHYGERGISVCDEWIDDFMSFYNWAISNGYKKGLSIERVNNDGNYSPENCIWATMKTQGRNKRNVKLFTLGDETMCLQDWATKIGIERCALAKRLKRLSLKDALTKPPTKKYQHYAT